MKSKDEPEASAKTKASGKDWSQQASEIMLQAFLDAGMILEPSEKTPPKQNPHMTTRQFIFPSRP
jgi:hypothetical protein